MIEAALASYRLHETSLEFIGRHEREPPALRACSPHKAGKEHSLASGAPDLLTARTARSRAVCDRLVLKNVMYRAMPSWEEYQTAHGERAYRYSQFCWHYQPFLDRLARSMRQAHRAGEKLFIDYSGDTVPVINALTGEIVRAEIFIASMGASKYTYAEATWTQRLPDWIASHIRMLEYLGCVPEILTPDNLKSAIKKAGRYEPAAPRMDAGLPRAARQALNRARLDSCSRTLAGPPSVALTGL